MISLSKSKEVEFHILADIVVEKLNQTKSIEQVIWREIKSLGKIVIPKKEAPFKSTVRTVTLSTIYGGNPLVMSEMMGCDFSHEYVKEGNRFVSKTGYFVDVFVVKKVKKRANVTTNFDKNQPEPFEILDAGLLAVEAYSYAPQSQDAIYIMEKELLTLADSLANIEVYLFKDN
ncbi:predicted protein [Naegleria gruberi]|uniref:Mediator of RNA polymerase II transcription subunit 18 n=1 Tax=Naegleria gruberi TaxID=5762 RepID=D2UXJ0_NAEGR|nr:uncharacterized protein NAEGRDRAFT_61142 [Naegleria gruberi]EFC50641.1 predicted protein [Naegleria gruberi]|eukprot:XP_002683385.1 predicted protein [Naegleria gruberi strain NEG-M]